MYLLFNIEVLNTSICIIHHKIAYHKHTVLSLILFASPFTTNLLCGSLYIVPKLKQLVCRSFNKDHKIKFFCYDVSIINVNDEARNVSKTQVRMYNIERIDFKVFQ